MEDKNVKQEDIITHLGDDYHRFEGAIVPPIFQNSLFVMSKDEDSKHMDWDGNQYVYTRMSNPTIELAEKKIAALEGGESARCFSSGMAAISASIMHFVEKDCHVVAVRSLYSGAREVFNDYLKKFGVEVTYVKGDDAEEFEKAIRPNTKLIYLESPSTFTFVIQDLEKIAQIAKTHGIGTVIDNTYATPIHQNPLKYGIDIVVHTVSKYLSGHSDIVGGVAVGSKKIMQEMAAKERALLGGNMDPHQAWLLTRGMRTLTVRLKQHEENALKVAEYLEGHPKVKRVIYPGLKSFPQYEMAKKYLSGNNGLLSFIPDSSGENIMKFVKALEYFQWGCSWGGFESLVMPIGVGMDEETSKRNDTPINLVRLHIGLENVDTLIKDLDNAMKNL